MISPKTTNDSDKNVQKGLQQQSLQKSSDKMLRERNQQFSLLEMFEQKQHVF